MRAQGLPRSEPPVDDGAIAQYRAVRRNTGTLCQTLEPEDYVVQSMPDASPAKWHLAHTSWFFERFLLAEYQCGYRPFDERFDYLFNSYYHTAGPMHQRPRRGLLSRPTVADVLAYRAHVDDAMERLIESDALDVRARNILMLGLHHEQQHQELLLTDLKHLFSQNPLEPAVAPELPPPPRAAAPGHAFLAITGGIHEIGHRGEGFAFDNETPRHRVLLDDFRIGSRPITNGEYRDFVRDGAYARPELWLSDGWATLAERGWRRPLYWDEELCSEFTLAGRRDLDPHAPVSHVSYYEADA
ncbi:MAG: ergothioneine biosynthesis protein EgtB, partial [Woeseiaceae bacterium]